MLSFNSQPHPHPRTTVSFRFPVPSHRHEIFCVTIPASIEVCPKQSKEFSLHLQINSCLQLQSFFPTAKFYLVILTICAYTLMSLIVRQKAHLHSHCYSGHLASLRVRHDALHLEGDPSTRCSGKLRYAIYNLRFAMWSEFSVSPRASHRVVVGIGMDLTRILRSMCDYNQRKRHPRH